MGILAIYKVFSLTILLIPIIIYQGLVQFNLHCWRLSPHAIIYFEHIANDNWRFRTRAGKSIRAKVCAYPFRSRWLIIFTYLELPTMHKKHMLIAYDATLPLTFSSILSSLWNHDNAQL